MDILLVSAFFIGLTSNLHCLGMCGPISTIIPVNRKNNWTILAGLSEYNLGRILTYSILGATSGIIGFTIQTYQTLQILSIGAGIILIIYAWNKRYNFIRVNNPTQKMTSRIVQKYMGLILNSKSNFKLFLFGMVNGILPCGMVYIALINATIIGDPWFSAIAMFVFGIGTLPVMLIANFFIKKMNWKSNPKWNKIIPYLISVLGLLIILRGLNLGIPYLSPKIDKTTVINESNKIKVDTIDCH